MELISLFNIPEQVLIEIVKASPFAFMCIVFVFILSGTYRRNLKELNLLHQKTIEDIKQVYKEVYGVFDKRIKSKA